MRIPPNRPDNRIAGRKVIGPKPSLIPPSSQRSAEASTKNPAPIASPSAGRSRGNFRNSVEILVTNSSVPPDRLHDLWAKDNRSEICAGNRSIGFERTCDRVAQRRQHLAREPRIVFGPDAGPPRRMRQRKIARQIAAEVAHPLADAPRPERVDLRVASDQQGQPYRGHSRQQPI